MDVKICPLTPGMAGEFFRYFEESAFPPGDPRANCYCLESHLRDEACYEEVFDRRMQAKELIDSGKMTGYLLFDGQRPVGWCNAGDKLGYEPVREDSRFFTTGCERGQIKIIYCMDIAGEYQGRGLASLLMERFLSDARAEGYLWAVGYPFADREYIYQYHGPARLWEKHGFTLFGRRGGYDIYRKVLREGMG